MVCRWWVRRGKGGRTQSRKLSGMESNNCIAQIGEYVDCFSIVEDKSTRAWLKIWAVRSETEKGRESSGGK